MTTDEQFWKDAENLHHRAMNENAPFTSKDADNERAWMDLLTASAKQFRAVMEEFNLQSQLTTISCEAFDNFLHDEIPDIERLIEQKRMNP